MNLPETFQQQPGTLVIEGRLKCGGCSREETMHNLQIAGTQLIAFARDAKEFLRCDLNREDGGPWYEIPHFGFYCLPCAKKLRAGMVRAVREMRGGG